MNAGQANGTERTTGVDRPADGSPERAPDDSLTQAYRRLLRWYPRSRREHDGAVLLGTLLDAAEAEGRTRPTAGEAWSLRLTGAGEHLTHRAALIAGTVALIAATLTTLLLLTGVAGRVVWLSPLLLGFLIPVSLAVALCAALQARRLLSPVRALTTISLAVLASAVVALTLVSWSVGWDEADAGVERSALALAFPLLYLAGWGLGAATLAVAVSGLCGGLPLPLRAAVTAVAAVVSPPLLGLLSIHPFFALLLAAALVPALLLAGPRPDGSTDPVRGTPESAALAPASPSPAPRPSPAPLPPLPVTTLPVLPDAPADRGRPTHGLARPATAPHRTAAVLAGVASLLIGGLGIAFALVGSGWVGEIDSTRAMQLGIAVAGLGLIPLVVRGAEVLCRRRPAATLLLRLAATAVGLGFAVAAVQSVLGDTRGGVPIVPGLFLAAGAGLLAAGLARSRPLGVRVLLAVSVALPVSVYVGWILVLTLPFATPLLACVALVLALRRRRTPGGTVPRVTGPVAPLATR